MLKDKRVPVCAVVLFVDWTQLHWIGVTLETNASTHVFEETITRHFIYFKPRYSELLEQVICSHLQNEIHNYIQAQARSSTDIGFFDFPDHIYWILHLKMNVKNAV